MPSESSRSGIVLELAEEFLERYRRGERPSLKEYIDRRPDLASEIREVFPAMAMMEKVAIADESLAPASEGCPRPDSPQQIGDYRIIRQIGHGGMGIVYEAEQVSLGRHVALKVLPRKMLLDERSKRRFEREAKAAAKLHHTNIVPVFGVGEHEGLPYYVMQFIQGQALDAVLSEISRLKQSPAGTPKPDDNGLPVRELARSLVTGEFRPAVDPTVAEMDGHSTPQAKPSSGRSGSLSHSSSVLPGARGGVGDRKATFWHSVAEVGWQVADALAHAHKQGVLHRDIKPSNLLLDTRGSVWVADFGLAKADDQQNLTQAGDILGTLRYMPPEAFEGHSDARGDVYSLGLTLYEMVTLKPAFDEKDRPKLIKRVTSEEAPRLECINPAVPRDLATIIHKAIDRDPARRYSCADDFKEDLARFLADRPIQARRISSAERVWRWGRRNPAVAGLLGAVSLLVLAVAIISTGAALWLRASLNESESQRVRAEEAERDQKRKVYEGHVTEAKYRRFSHLQGQRYTSLGAIRQALQLLPSLDMTDGEREQQRHKLRDLAISCLTLPDVRLAREWEAWPGDSVSLEFDDRGEWYARSNRQGQVIVRRLTDDGEVASVPGDGQPAWSHFTPEERLLVVWRTSNKVEGWRLNPAQLLFQFRAAGPPSNIRVNRTGKIMAVMQADGTLSLYDLPEGTLRRREKLPPGTEPLIDFSPDGRWLAAISGEYQNPFGIPSIDSQEPPATRSVLHVFDLTTDQPPRHFRHADVIRSFAWYPDSQTLAAGGWNESNEIFVWDLPSGGLLRKITAQKGGESRLRINPTGDVLTSTAGWGSGGIRLWHPQTGKELLNLPGYWYFNGSFRDGRLISSTINGTMIRVVEYVPGAVRRSIVRDQRAEKEKQYVSPALHPNGRLLAVSMETGVGLWDLLTERELGHLTVGRVQSVHFDTSGALWTNGHAGVLRWPVRGGREVFGPLDVGPPQMISALASFGLAMAISADGSVVAVTGGLSPTRVFRRDHPGQSIPLRHDSDVRETAVSPDGRWVATIGRGPPQLGVKVWEARTGRMVAHLYPEQRCGGVVFTPDGQFLVVDHDWLQVGSWQKQKTSAEWYASFAAISPDGHLLAYWRGPSEDQGIHLFDGRTDRRLGVLGSPDQGRVYSMIFNRNGTRLIGVDLDNTVVQVWDLRKLREELKALDLDWDTPPFPPASPDEDAVAGPRPVRVHLGDLEDDVVLSPQPSQDHLRSLIALNSLSLALQPFDPKAHRQRGRAFALLNEPELALDDFARALALMPPDDLGRADLLGRRARIYLTLKDYDKVVADLDESEKVDPVRGRWHRQTLAMVLVRRGSLARRQDAAEAIRDLRHAVVIDPDSEVGHNNLAWLLLTGPPEHRDAGAGLLHARRAVDLSNESATHLNTLGVAQYRNQQYREAIVTLEKSLGASGLDEATFDLYFLALCHAKLGEAAGAKERYDEAVKSHDTHRAKFPGDEGDLLNAFRAEAAAALGEPPPREPEKR